MTSYQGIAVVSQTLSYLMTGAVHTAVPGATVSMMRPEESPAGSRQESRANLYLVQVIEDPVARNDDLPLRATTGQLLSTPSVARKLRYLLSFFGPSAQAQLMLGAIDVALREQPVLTPELIDAAVFGHDPLRGSGLEIQTPPVRVTPVDLTMEELSRFWSGFFHSPYTLSTMYEASTVILDSALAPIAQLPVRGLRANFASSPPPTLDPLPTVTFSRGLAIPVSGRRIQAGQRLKVGATWATIEADAGGSLHFVLPNTVQAGTQLVWLGAQASGQATASGIVAGSSPSAITIRPAVKYARYDPGAHTVSVDVAPRPEVNQAIALSLADASGTGSSIRISGPAAVVGSQLQFKIPALPAGTYLVIVEVDGAASVPGFAGERYDTPEVEIG